MTPGHVEITLGLLLARGPAAMEAILGVFYSNLMVAGIVVLSVGYTLCTTALNEGLELVAEPGPGDATGD